jgi:hypothetical protein
MYKLKQPYLMHNIAKAYLGFRSTYMHATYHFAYGHM